MNDAELRVFASTVCDGSVDSACRECDARHVCPHLECPFCGFPGAEAREPDAVGFDRYCPICCQGWSAADRAMQADIAAECSDDMAAELWADEAEREEEE